MRRALMVVLIVGMVLIWPLGVSASAGGLIHLESSPPVFDVLYKYGQVEGQPDGAYGANVHASPHAWYIEEQRAGGVDIFDGVFRSDPSLIAEGLKILHYGLAREAANGSFPGSAWPFHGTALFLSETAPALLALKHSPYESQFGSELRWETVRMRRAAHEMIALVGGPGKIDDTTKNHRYFEAAIALGAVGVLAGDKTLRQWSTIYAWHGIHMERPNGVMPEDGGHDSGYQALGMVNASRYLVLVASGSLHRALYAALAKGEAWELSRIAPDGAVNQAGDTRTVNCEEHSPSGSCKTVFYAPIFSALAHWAAITNNGRYERASYQVWLHSGYGGH